MEPKSVVIIIISRLLKLNTADWMMQFVNVRWERDFHAEEQKLNKFLRTNSRLMTPSRFPI